MGGHEVVAHRQGGSLHGGTKGGGARTRLVAHQRGGSLMMVGQGRDALSTGFRPSLQEVCWWEPSTIRFVRDW